MRIGRPAINAIVAHALETAPAECCGLLLGLGDTISEAVRVRNIADRPTRYLLDPKGHIDARRSGRDRGLDVLGFYHSHPQAPAEPSEIDQLEASYPDHLYLIVALGPSTPEIGLFRFDGRNFRPEPFVTVD